MALRLRREDYTVGWVCPLEVEQIAALRMLDIRHDRLPQPVSDHNVYNLGSIAGHNVVIAGLPQAGNNSAAAVVTQLRTTYPNVKFGLLVGIGGGVPVKTDSGMIRLGDVIISKPTGPHSGAVQYDHGKMLAGSFQRTGALAPPPAVLLNAAQDLASNRAMLRDDPIAKSIERIDTTLPLLRHFAYPGARQDRLFKADYVHQQHGVPCDECGCEASQRIARRADGADDMYIRIHRGTIASGELVLKDAILRDRLAKDGLICFEMEAAGALTDFPCLVIRGVSDYCDSHKNDMWHGYAAAAAAAYARQLFFHMPIDEVQHTTSSRQHLSYPLNATGPVKTFVERPGLLKNIREQLVREDHDNTQPRIVGVWGSGGMGKTQLVLSYVQHYHSDYDGTFWLQAKQTASIDRDLLEIHRQLPKTGSSLVQKPDDVRREVLMWFAATPGRWLLVFDGADQLSKNDRDYVDLFLYIPRCRDLHVIFTSRIAIARRLSSFEGLQVGELEGPQAASLFRRCAEIQRTDEKTNQEVKEVVRELGYLALAISIAGAYVSQSPTRQADLSRYLVEYRRRRHDLLAELPDEVVDKYEHSVMTVWETSFAAVKEQQPQACQLLTLLSFIDYQDIFLELFGLDSDPTATSVVKLWAAIFDGHPFDYYSLERCFIILERYTLVQRQMDRTSYTMHRLVHAWGHDRQLTDSPRMKLFCQAAFDMVFEAMLECSDRPESKLRLVPHLRSTTKNVVYINTSTGAEEIEVIDKVEMISNFTTDIGSWNEAAAMKQEVLEKRRRILGEEHPATISAMNNLAGTLRDQGKLDSAAAIMQEVLEKTRRILGAEHPNTISTMNNLANTLGDQGKLNEAAAMNQEVLEKMRRVLGVEHPNTILAMNNLSGMLRDQGKLNEAAAMNQEVLEKRRRILGEEHPHTITAMGNLAGMLRDQGKLDEAAAIMQEVLEKIQRILGAEHPKTITAIGNLAITLGHQGKLGEAVAMMHEVLEKRQRILGEEHPDTITAIGNLATTLGHQEKLGEAVVMMLREDAADPGSRAPRHD
ncbi:FxSxx-COOH system tetratricopeptide repeat protein [Microdochium nivale]|nr:FxSxx-COOH system tetratricopeptide repeat protein [Microdochium nivale]